MMDEMAEYGRLTPDVADEIISVQHGARKMIERKLAQGLPVHEGGAGPDEGFVFEVRAKHELEVSASQRPLNR